MKACPYRRRHEWLLEYDYTWQPVEEARTSCLHCYMEADFHVVQKLAILNKEPLTFTLQHKPAPQPSIPGGVTLSSLQAQFNQIVNNAQASQQIGASLVNGQWQIPIITQPGGQTP